MYVSLFSCGIISCENGDMVMELLNLEYTNKESSDDDYVIIVDKGGILVNVDGSFLLASECDGEFQYAFEYDGKAFYLGNEIRQGIPTKWLSALDIRQSLGYENAMMVSIALQFQRFYVTNKYCGRCGKKMIPATDERAMVCECGFRKYPTIAPASITAIIDRENDCILLTKGINMTSGYGLVAGFVEAGETFEECALREIKEEVGLQVKNLKYFGNQPWGFGDNIMVAFTAELDGDPTFTMQEKELKKVWWQPRSTIEVVERPLSIGHKMVQAFRKGEI